MVIVKGSIEFTKLLIKIILEERKSCKGRSLQLVGKYYFFVKKKKRKSANVEIHTSNLLTRTIWIILESNIYLLVFNFTLKH